MSDLSLWGEYKGVYYTSELYGYLVFEVSRNITGNWKWYEINRDGWDGEKVVEEISDSSEISFATWEEAALDCQKNNEGYF